ncbi:uncharacterized protein LOC141595463 [Silene latifolia]|uniref:uncharacterized protein LOC141595463 n=1 Tax=Silene latifolia TaxID=37657 RepID=UPI003D778894
MDREWMFVDRLDSRYREGVEYFVRHAMNNAENVEQLFCPCVKCGNNEYVDAVELESHLLINGIDKSYTRWIWHGEDVLPTLCSNLGDDSDFEGEDFDENVDRVDNLINDLKKSAVDPSEIEILKAKNGWSDKSFTTLLEFLGQMLPEGNELPRRTYDAKKILCPMGVDYVKIHACRNDCILFRKDYKELDKCPKCGSSRYKLPKKNSTNSKGVPVKVLWYLPIIPRFKRMFANLKEARNLIWHAGGDGRILDDKIRHPADSTRWKSIDHLFPEFGSDARNLRLGLCTDGMNPFGNLSSRWSTWLFFANNL